MKLFILLLFNLVSSALADSGCSPVNLITETDSPFSKIPVYDQKDSNICYAYAASQIVDFHLIKQGAQKPTVHPAWLALNYALARNRKGLDIGHTKESIERLSEVNNCDFDTVKDALYSWAGTRDIQESKIIAFIEKYSRPDRSPASFDTSSARMFSELRKMALNPVDVISRILLPSCQNRQTVTVPKVTKYNFSQLPDDSAFEKFLVERIAKNPAPISIAYCSKVWKDPEYDGIDFTFFGKRDSLKKDCDYHESLVVGRKPAGNTCQLLVRNTWGTEWKNGNRKWKCLCKDRTTGQFIDDCQESTHPDEKYSVEACWIPSDKLGRNVGVITFTE